MRLTTSFYGSIVYMHAGVCNEHAEDMPLIRELELHGVAAQVPDLLEPSPEHQPESTPSQHAAPGATGEAERVHIIQKLHINPCMTVY